MNQPQVYIVLLPLELPSHLHPISPSRLSENTGFALPASYIKFPLAIYFTYGKCIYFLASSLTVCVILSQVNLTNTWGLEVFFSLFS